MGAFLFVFCCRSRLTPLNLPIIRWRIYWVEIEELTIKDTDLKKSGDVTKY